MEKSKGSKATREMIMNIKQDEVNTKYSTIFSKLSES